jgi:hypothetical protein
MPPSLFVPKTNPFSFSAPTPPYTTILQTSSPQQSPPTARKRKLSEMQERPAPPHYPREPSPVPTLVVDEDQSVKVERAEKEGVKVRDYALESTNPPVTEVYRYAILDLANYDALLRKRHLRPFVSRGLAISPTGGHGKVLRRLLDLGWITREEQEKNFTKFDKDALEVYDSSPRAKYPWKAPNNLRQPSPLDRRDNWRARFPPTTQDIPESSIFSSVTYTEEDENEHRRKRAKQEEARLAQMAVDPPKLQPLMKHTRRQGLIRSKTMASLF